MLTQELNYSNRMTLFYGQQFVGRLKEYYRDIYKYSYEKIASTFHFNWKKHVRHELGWLEISKIKIDHLPAVELIPDAVELGHIDLERRSVVIFVFCYETMDSHVQCQQLLFQIHDLGKFGLEHNIGYRKTVVVNE